jgi:O-antigen/teichoic acid export membrane protein/glycosyltransferase involved in cell wall biosynthesis
MKNTSFLRGKQVVFLASIDWDAAWQRHQALAKNFSEAGATVYFIENTGFRMPRLSDAGRILQRVLNVLLRERSSKREHPIPERVKLVAPLVAPPTSRAFRALNRTWLLPRLVSKLKRRGLTNPTIVIAYIPSQTTVDLIDQLGAGVNIYDVVDHFGGHPEPPPNLIATEEALIRRADLLFTTSPLLQSLHENRHSHVERIHHGVSENFFCSPPRPPKKHKRLCYFGTLREGLDYDALNHLAQAGFEVELIGPEKDPPPPLEPGIRLTGMVSSEELVERIASFDAILFPYDNSEFNKGITPAKIFESLATGLPIISSVMPGLKAYDHLLYIAKTSKEFVSAAKSLDTQETTSTIEKRLNEARKHSAATQFEKMTGHIQAAIKRRPLHDRVSPPALPQPIRAFLRGIRWITLFFATAKFATLLAQMAAARVLGPGGYGQANLVLAVNAVLQIVPMLGFPLALSHFAPQQETDYQRRKIISSTLTAFGLWAIAGLGFFYWTAEPLRTWAGLSAPAWNMALLLAFLSAGHLTVTAGLQGLTWFKRRGSAESLYGLGTLLLLAVLYTLGFSDYRLLILALAGGFGLSIMFGLWQLRNFIRPVLSPGSLRKIGPYAAVGTLNVLAAALTQAPGRISAYNFIGPEAAGIYSAYFTATVQVALALITMTWTVLIPVASLPDGQREAWKQLRRLMPALILGSLILFSLSGTAALTLIGRSYPLRWDWLILFILSATAIVGHGLFAAVFAARGFRGLIISTAGAVTAGLTNLTLNMLWTPRWGVSGAAGALLTGYVISLAWYLLYQPEAEAE